MRWQKIPCYILLFSLVIMFGTASSARESYEDYWKNKKEKSEERTSVKRDRPLSEMKTGEREGLYDELRGAVREEIDSSLSKERKASKKKINEDKLISDVKKIVREEIEDAIRLKEKKYLRRGTMEIGGFVSLNMAGLEGNETDNNLVVKVFPMVNYFITDNIALGMKAAAEMNFTTDTQDYNGGIGPQFAFGMNDDETWIFYATMFAGISKSAAGGSSISYRYGNEIGIKVVLTSGVILNFGTMLVFDNGGSSGSGFQNIVVPAIGISAWF